MRIAKVVVSLVNNNKEGNAAKLGAVRCYEQGRVLELSGVVDSREAPSESLCARPSVSESLNA